MTDVSTTGPTQERKSTSQPLYIQLAGTIYDRIENGRYPVGSLLPTEAELCKTFGVSRHTVRQAIQHLRLQGLVTARKGVGTRVDAKSPKPAYTQSIHTMSEVLQYAQATRLELDEVRTQTVRGQTAMALNCRPGKAWLFMKGLRYEPDNRKPICLSEIFVDTAFRSIADDARKVGLAICGLIESRFGETIVEVEQEIESVVLSEDEATALSAETASPALRVTRRYFANGRRLLEMAVSLHPADRFKYSVTLKRDLPGNTHS